MLNTAGYPAITAQNYQKNGNHLYSRYLAAFRPKNQWQAKKVINKVGKSGRKWYEVENLS